MSERRKDDTIIAKKVGSIIEKRVGNYFNNIMLQNISHENGEIPANIGGYEKIRIDGDPKLSDRARPPERRRS
jgi:hypothetical protein